jgi:hypothetical protein
MTTVEAKWRRFDGDSRATVVCDIGSGLSRP